jgi:hypothetical protein
MDKKTNCDPCEEQGNITEGKRWCPICDEKLCNGCASHHRSRHVPEITFIRYDPSQKTGKLNNLNVLGAGKPQGLK